MSMKRKVNYTNGYAVIHSASFLNFNDIAYQHFNPSTHSIIGTWFLIRSLERDFVWSERNIS